MGANLYAIDARTGEKVWQKHVDDHAAAFLTATPQYHDGVLYVPASSYEEVLATVPTYACCGFRGSVSAFEAGTGNLLWKTYTIAEEVKPQRAARGGTPQKGPSGAGVWTSPTIDPSRGLLYVSTGDNYSDPPTKTSDAIMAFDLKTGRTVWVKQVTEGDAYNLGCNAPSKKGCPNAEGPDFDFGSSPILVDLRNGKRALVVGQKSGLLYALDPDQKGKILWQARLGQGGVLGGLQWGSAVEADRVYTPLSDLRFSRGRRGGPEVSTGPIPGRWALRVPDQLRRTFVAHASTTLRRPASVQPGAIRSGERDSGRGLFGIARRALAGVQRPRREDHLGLRHEPRLRNREWRSGARRRDRRPGSDHRRRTTVRGIGICAMGRIAGECAAGILSGRQIGVSFRFASR